MHRVRTPEGVSFSFRLASPVLRMCAWLVDAMVVSAAWSTVSTVLGLIGFMSQDLARMVMIIGYFVVSHGYRIWMEYDYRGQTLGKKLFRLRVVDTQGHTLTFAQVAMRNLLRIVDALPALYLVGGTTALFSGKSQRLGDFAAGTLVIWQPREEAPAFDLQRSGKYNSLRAHPAVVARLRQEVLPAEANAAWQALARRERLEPAARMALFRQIADYFQGKVRLPEEVCEGVAPEQLVRNIVEVLYLDRR